MNRRTSHEVLYDRLLDYVTKYGHLMDGRERDDFGHVIQVVDEMSSRAASELNTKGE